MIELTSPVVMGIINTTPDSFYAASRIDSVGMALDKAEAMIRDGAAILDIGGMSTRPGAGEVSPEQELDRVIPIIRAIHDRFPETVLSIDTYRSAVAAEAVKAGATMINDVSGGQLDDQMFDVAAESKVPYILMHMRGTPADMQQHTDYKDIIGDIVKYFVKHLTQLKSKGVADILLDPGFGFAKTPEQNFQVIEKLEVFGFFGLPVVVGVSRKSTIGKTVGRPVEDTLEATTALHMAALERGASVLRVHDVRAARDTIAVFNQLRRVKTLNNKRLSRV